MSDTWGTIANIALDTLPTILAWIEGEPDDTWNQFSENQQDLFIQGAMDASYNSAMENPGKFRPFDVFKQLLAQVVTNEDFWKWEENSPWFKRSIIPQYDKKYGFSFWEPYKKPSLISGNYKDSAIGVFSWIGANKVKTGVFALVFILVIVGIIKLIKR